MLDSDFPIPAGYRFCEGECGSLLPPGAFAKDIVIEGATGIRRYPRKLCKACQNAETKLRRPSRSQGARPCDCCHKISRRLEHFEGFRVDRRCSNLLHGLRGDLDVRGALSMAQLVGELEALVEHRMAYEEFQATWRGTRRPSRAMIREAGGERAACPASNHERCVEYETLYRSVLSFYQNHCDPQDSVGAS